MNLNNQYDVSWESQRAVTKPQRMRKVSPMTSATVRFVLLLEHYLYYPFFIPLNSDELPRQQLRLHVGQFRQLRGHGPHPWGGSLRQGEGQGEPRHR